MNRRFLCLCLLALVVVLPAGCRKSRPRLAELPLPPVGDSGLANGCYVQAEYGFSIPVPKGYASYAPNPDDEPSEDFDEWIRFMDPKKEALVRLMTEETPETSPSERELKERLEKVFATGEYKVTAVGKTLEWPGGDDTWMVVPYDLQDKVKKEWRTWACALPHDGLVIWVRATLPLANAKKAQGDKLLAVLKEALGQVKWYQPVGDRGISLEHYELKRFGGDFLKALESGSVNRTLAFFDETSPARFQWVDRYKVLLGGREAPAKGSDPILKVQEAGLVINGKRASLYYKVQGADDKPVSLGFRLAKEDRAWGVVALENLEKR